MSEDNNTETTRAWWKRPWLIVAAVVIVGLAILRYFTLYEPRYIFPRAADDWAAWGTWVGAGFTGGALIFAGYQFRGQSQALQRELTKQARAEEVAAGKRLAFAMQAHIEAKHVAHDHVLSLNTWEAEPIEVNGWLYGVETKITFVAPSSGAIANLEMHLPELPLEPAEYDPQDYGEASAESIPLAREARVIWRDRPLQTGPESRTRYDITPLAVDKNDLVAPIPGIRLGEKIQIVLFSREPVGNDAYFTFTDGNGFRFRAAIDGKIAEIGPAA